MIYSSPKQRQLIGYFRKILKMRNDIYYEILFVEYKVKSSKELLYAQADDLIDYLRKKATSLGLYAPKNNYYTNLYNRSGMATVQQLRKINIMWKNVSRQTTDKEREIALNHFVKRIAKKEHINFLTKSDVHKVVNAIKAIERQKENETQYAVY